MADSVIPALPELGKDVTVPGPNAKHGLYSTKAIIRSLLSEGEAEAWDEAPVPVGTSPDVEEVMREYAVQRYRVHAWEKARPMLETGKVEDRLKELKARLDLMHRPLRGQLKAIEVQARIREAEGNTNTSEAIVAYLKSLPSHRLGEILLNEEAPRFHPDSGQPLLPTVSRETLPGTGAGSEQPSSEAQSDVPNEGDDDPKEQ